MSVDSTVADETETRRKSANEFALSLFGSVHIDRPSKVADELDEFADGVDAVFVEYPQDWSLREKVEGLLKNPMLVVGVMTYTVVFLPFLSLFVRDVIPMELVVANEFAEKRNIELHAVDTHPIQLSNDGKRWWWVVSWGVLALLVWYQPLAASVTVVAIVGASLLRDVAARWNRTVVGVLQFPFQWGVLLVMMVERLFSILLVLVAFLFFLIAVGRTIQTRNEAMIDRADEIAEREGYESGCLMTGRAHVAGMVVTAERLDITIPRTYRPRWLRYGGEVTEDPEPDEDIDIDSNWPTRPRPRTFQMPIFRRIVAAVIDSAFIILIAMLVSAMLFDVMPEDPAVILSFVSIPPLFHFAFESVLGRTPGKKLSGIAVMSNDGSLPSTRALFLRNLFRPLDFVVFYGLGFLMLLLTKRKQRLGDKVANTVVVKV